MAHRDVVPGDLFRPRNKQGLYNQWLSRLLENDLDGNLLEHRIGLEPHKTNLIVSAEGTKVNEMLEHITNNIAFLPWFQNVFPNVKPDKGRWSENGYWVVDSSMPYEKWVEKMSYTIDPTITGGGLESNRINGKHPSGVFLTDDLHGKNNSTSENQRKNIVKTYTTEFSKTFKRDGDNLVTWPVNIGVPWGVSGDKSDVHQVLKKSGGFVSSAHPVMRSAEEGQDGAIYIDGYNAEEGVVYDDIKGWWILANPDIFGPKSIQSDRGLGKFDFWQMMMMDITTARSGGVKYYGLSRKDVEMEWPCITGVDPSYTMKERGEYETKSSHLAVANVLKRPRGGAVLVGGILKQCTVEEASTYLKSTKSRFYNHDHFEIENVGMGQLFKKTMELLAPALQIFGSDLGGIRLKGEKAGKAKDKVTRIRMELAPWLEKAIIFIMDPDDEMHPDDREFLEAVRDGLENLSELDPHKPDKRLDALDAFYHGVKAMPDVLQQMMVGEELLSVSKQKQQSPFEGRLALRRR